MATDATGTHPRRAPLPPSARSAGTASGRRPSNRPPPKSLFNAAPSPAARDAAGAIPRPGSVAASPSVSLPSVAGNAQAVRDDLVRAIMPELRTLVEHLVKTTVERNVGSLLERQRELQATDPRTAQPPLDQQRELEGAIERALGPLVAKQRELEAALGELRRAESRFHASSNVAAERAPEARPAPGRLDVATTPFSARTVPIAPALNRALGPVAVRPRGDAISAAYDADAPVELPSELNGARRKRAVVWILAIGVILLLLTVAGLAALSNMGRYL